MMSLIYLLCFKLYLDEAPNGVFYCKMSNYYVDALEKMQELIILHKLSGLLKFFVYYL